MYAPSCQQIQADCLNDIKAIDTAPACISNKVIPCMGEVTKEMGKCIGDVLMTQKNCISDIFKKETDVVSNQCADDLNDRFENEFRWILIVILFVLVILIGFIIVVYKNTKNSHPPDISSV
jgi:hypothetical protein